MRGAIQVVGGRRRFSLHYERHAACHYSPPDEEQVAAKETDGQAEREGFPRGGGKIALRLAGGKGVSR